MRVRVRVRARVRVRVRIRIAPGVEVARVPVRGNPQVGRVASALAPPFGQSLRTRGLYRHGAPARRLGGLSHLAAREPHALERSLFVLPAEG